MCFYFLVFSFFPFPILELKETWHFCQGRQKIQIFIVKAATGTKVEKIIGGDEPSKTPLTCNVYCLL